MNALLVAAYEPFMRLTERACLQAWRAEVLDGVSGRVLEIGPGLGANLPYLGGAREVVFAEPSAAARARLAPRVAERKLPGVVIDAPSGALPFEDGHFDEVVCTLVLCSVPDPAQTLAEVRRVLRPGGRIRFIEHVAAWDDPSRRWWQGAIDPVWRTFAGGCRLTRDTEAALSLAGFEFERLTRDKMRAAFPFLRPTIRGHARRG